VARVSNLKQGVCHTLVALPFTLKKVCILRRKKNYGNSNISPSKNIIFKKNPLKETNNPSRSYYNSITNPKLPTQAKISSFFTKSSYKNRPIIIT